MKTILIISGGIEAADAAKHAREMGLHVVVSDINPDAPGFAHAHDRIIADVYGAEETADAAEKFARELRPIDGVICVAADAPMTVAAVAERLGLPGISMQTAMIACDKLAMKMCFAAKGVPVPWFTSVGSAKDVRVWLKERGSDFVIKPVDSRGSRGVQRLARVTDIDAAYALAEKYSPSGRVMIEEYIGGPQVSTESIVTGAKCFTVGFSDRNYELLETHAPFFIENGGDLPSHLPEATQEKVRAVVAKAATALGVKNGTVKGDIVIDDDGEPYVIELAARLSGGFFCTREIPLNTGVDFIGCAIRVALGEKVSKDELTPHAKTNVVQRYVFPQPGKVVGVSGDAAARAVPGISDIVITARPGDVIPPAGDKRPSGAMVLATGTSHAAALEAANAALAQIRIETQ